MTITATTPLVLCPECGSSTSPTTFVDGTSAVVCDACPWQGAAPAPAALMCRHCGAWWDATDEMPCCLFPQAFDLNADADPGLCPCGNDAEHAPGDLEVAA